MTKLKHILARIRSLKEYAGANPLEVFDKSKNSVYDDVFFTKSTPEQKSEIDRVMEQNSVPFY